MLTDWSLDENRERLREALRGREHEAALEAGPRLTEEFWSDLGPGQYSHIRFADWLTENHPATIAVMMRVTL